MKFNFIGKSILIETIQGERILVIGDLHLGYEASLNAGGIFVTRTLLNKIKEDIEEILAFTNKIDEIILLGDIRHSLGSILKEEWEETREIVEFLKERSKKTILIKGNHDNLTSIVGKYVGFEIRDYYIKEDCAFIHGDKDFRDIWDSNVKNIFMGHIHPAIIITDGIKREKYKCFLEGKFKNKKMIVLPSFITANEGTDPREYKIKLPWIIKLENFNVNIVGENLEVLNFGKLKNIK